MGDDWQSIYRFAGSDVSVMREFQDYFGAAEVTKLDKTFRYNDKICQFSAEFIQRNPGQISKDVTTITYSDTPEVFFINGEESELDYVMTL